VKGRERTALKVMLVGKFTSPHWGHHYAEPCANSLGEQSCPKTTNYELVHCPEGWLIPGGDEQGWGLQEYSMPRSPH